MSFAIRQKLLLPQNSNFSNLGLDYTAICQIELEK